MGKQKDTYGIVVYLVRDDDSEDYLHLTIRSHICPRMEWGPRSIAKLIKRRRDAEHWVNSAKKHQRRKCSVEKCIVVEVAETW